MIAFAALHELRIATSRALVDAVLDELAFIGEGVRAHRVGASALAVTCTASGPCGKRLLKAHSARFADRQDLRGGALAFAADIDCVHIRPAESRELRATDETIIGIRASTITLGTDVVAGFHRAHGIALFAFNWVTTSTIAPVDRVELLATTGWEC